jgi:hypothetical protein
MIRSFYMERLPYIDDHVKTVNAPAERVWAALLSAIRVGFGHQLPGPLVAAWGLEQAARSGDWISSVRVGDTVPGFAVAETEAPRLLSLRGRHRFSRYEFRFELDSPHPDRVEIHVRTSAVFPGVHGRIYRALVIGTGGHRIAVQRMLAVIGRRAEEQNATRSRPAPTSRGAQETSASSSDRAPAARRRR